MKINTKLVCAAILFLFTTSVNAEYYVVYNSPCPTYECGTTREVVYYPVYKSYKKHKRHHHVRHYSPVRRSHASISVYYNTMVYPYPSCPCSTAYYCSNCGPCACASSYEVYPADTCSSSLDRATADDNPGCYSGMNIDN